MSEGIRGWLVGVLLVVACLGVLPGTVTAADGGDLNVTVVENDGIEVAATDSENGQLTGIVENGNEIPIHASISVRFYDADGAVVSGTSHSDGDGLLDRGEFETFDFEIPAAAERVRLTAAKSGLFETDGYYLPLEITGQSLVRDGGTYRLEGSLKNTGSETVYQPQSGVTLELALYDDGELVGISDNLYAVERDVSTLRPGEKVPVGVSFTLDADISSARIAVDSERFDAIRDLEVGIRPPTEYLSNENADGVGNPYGGDPLDPRSIQVPAGTTLSLDATVRASDSDGYRCQREDDQCEMVHRYVWHRPNGSVVTGTSLTQVAPDAGERATVSLIVVGEYGTVERSNLTLVGTESTPTPTESTASGPGFTPLGVVAAALVFLGRAWYRRNGR